MAGLDVHSGEQDMEDGIISVGEASMILSGEVDSIILVGEADSIILVGE